MTKEVESQASTSSEAIDQLRAEIPQDHVILYVGRIHEDDPMPPT